MSLETAGFILLGFGLALLLLDTWLGLGVVADVAAPLLIAAGAVLLVHEHGYDPPAWLVALLAGSVVVFAVSTVLAVKRTRGLAFRADAEAMVGRTAVARTDLSPDGLVSIKGEQWPARSARGLVRSGETVTVTGRSGNRLVVDGEQAATRAASLPRRL